MSCNKLKKKIIFFFIALIIAIPVALYAWTGDPPGTDRRYRLLAQDILTGDLFITRLGYDITTHDMMGYGRFFALDNADDIGDGSFGVRFIYLSDANTTAPSSNGQFGYNLNNNRFEFYENGAVTTFGAVHALLSATHSDTTASTVTRGDIIVGIGATTTWDDLALGAAGKILRSDGTDLLYSTSTFADTYTASNLLYASSANTVAGLATANNGVLVTSGTGVPSISAAIVNANLPTDTMVLLTFDTTATALTGTAILRAYTLPAGTYTSAVVMCGFGVVGAANTAYDWNVQIRDATVAQDNATQVRHDATGAGDVHVGNGAAAASFAYTAGNSVDAYATETTDSATLTAQWFAVYGVK